MRARVLLMVGTRRGAFLFESDPARTEWTRRGPLANPGWSFQFLTYDPVSRTLFAAGHNAWYGAAVWRSPDLGATWILSSEGITFGDDAPGVRQIWSLSAAHGRLYAGTDPAGLFVSADGGANWQQCGTPLRDLPGSEAWRPGQGGMPVHTVICHPTDPQQLWVAIAGGGVLYTADGGVTWSPRNPALDNGDPALRTQKLVLCGADPRILYQQNHRGVFRTTDGGQTWTDISAGLPTRFGFALALHPVDRDTLYTVPVRNADGVRSFPEGRLSVWQSRSGGREWQSLTEGLPAEPVYSQVLREGLATDSLSPAGIYLGTGSGQLYASRDEGSAWAVVAQHLPAIQSVNAAVLTEE